MESKVVIFVLVVIFATATIFATAILEVLILMLFLCRPLASTTSTFGEHFIENLR